MTTTTAPRAPGVGRMLVPEAGAGPPPPPEPKTLVPQVDGRAAAPPLVPPPIDTMASDDPRGTTAWAAVVGGGSVFDPPSFRDLSPEDFQKQWAQNIIADNARRRRRGELDQVQQLMSGHPGARQRARRQAEHLERVRSRV